MDRRRSRASVNRSPAGIRSRRRRLGARRSCLAPRASGHPLHESSSEAQSAKTGSDPTAAHGRSAVRLLRAAVFQCSQAATMSRLRPLSIIHSPTYPQRIAPRVTLAAADHPAAYAHPASCRLRPQPARRPPQSLSLGSLGASRIHSMKTKLLLLLLLLGGFLANAQQPLAPQSDSSPTAPQDFITVRVQGQVNRPGVFRLHRPANILHAIAEAEGIKRSGSSIPTTLLLIRKGALHEPEKIRLRVREVIYQPTELKDGDVIEVLEYTCVAAGSHVITPDGVRLIEELKVGDSVLGFDFTLNRNAFGRIASIHKGLSASLLILNKRLTVTSDHLVWSSEGWLEAGVLQQHVHQILTTDGPQPLTVVSDLGGPREVFDIAVESTSCFFADNILVHNKF
jgi:hypothetical protein